MYATINANAARIVGNITPKSINVYNGLTGNLHALNVATVTNYQVLYRGFWRLRFVDPPYLTAYFNHLEAHKGNTSLNPKAICTALQPVSTSLQFSFATKMAHMANPHSPIYDGLVRQFYFLPAAPSKADYAAKTAHYMASHAFLVAEYQRILANNLLDPAIAVFRSNFPASATHTDEKVIDWLIWSFVALADDGGFRTGVFQHA